MAKFQGQKQFFGKSLNKTKTLAGHFTKKGKKKGKIIYNLVKKCNPGFGLVKNFLLQKMRSQCHFSFDLIFHRRNYHYSRQTDARVTHHEKRVIFPYLGTKANFRSTLNAFHLKTQM